MGPSSGDSRHEGRAADTSSGPDGGCLFAAALIALGVVVQTSAWLWAHPLAAAAIVAASAAALVGLRWVLRHTGIGPSLGQFLQPLWDLIRAGTRARLTLVRTTLTTSVTDRVERWAGEPLARSAPGEPVASYVRRPMEYSLEAFEAATPGRFEEMCRELLDRDGFTDTARVGGAGDLGADVIADDHLGRRVVLQCKRYASPVSSEAVQRFNGTARPVHSAAVPVVVALNGFTEPAAAFAIQQRLHLVDRERLARWGAGQHFYDVLDIDRGPA
ncbi:restriction endonuclease [Kitasatospora indigofera]|uniref:restriction endonuclease n=1 Tax=Kitasatospora indigofera TaxID=67307 RepID=UPI0033B7A736